MRMGLITAPLCWHAFCLLRKVRYPEIELLGEGQGDGFHLVGLMVGVAEVALRPGDGGEVVDQISEAGFLLFGHLDLLLFCYASHYTDARKKYNNKNDRSSAGDRAELARFLHALGGDERSLARFLLRLGLRGRGVTLGSGLLPMVAGVLPKGTRGTFFILYIHPGGGLTH